MAQNEGNVSADLMDLAVQNVDEGRALLTPPSSSAVTVTPHSQALAQAQQAVLNPSGVEAAPTLSAKDEEGHLFNQEGPQASLSSAAGGHLSSVMPSPAPVAIGVAGSSRRGNVDGQVQQEPLVETVAPAPPVTQLKKLMPGPNQPIPENNSIQEIPNSPDSKINLCLPPPNSSLEEKRSESTFDANETPNQQNSYPPNRDSGIPNRSETPKEKCPICLAEPTNSSATDTCRHKFCFVCLLEWSKIKPTCPLCKQPFKSIIYNIRSEEEFDKYELPPPVPEAARPRPRFRYPTTMTTERLAILQRVRELQSRIMEQNSASRRGLSFSTSSWHAPAHGYGFHGGNWTDVARNALEAHRRTQQGERDYRELRRYRRLYLASENASRDQVVGSPDFRRLIYDRGLRVIPAERAPVPNQEAQVRLRDTRPEFFAENPAMIHRLIPWLTRELGVLLNNNPHQIQGVTEQIVSLLSRYPINGEHMERCLGAVLQQNTNHFIHEFYHFARSHYETLQEYDSHAFYAGNNNGREPELVNLDQEPDPEPREEGAEEGPLAHTEAGNLVGEDRDVVPLTTQDLHNGHPFFRERGRADGEEQAGSSSGGGAGGMFSARLQSQVSQLQHQLERLRNMLSARTGGFLQTFTPVSAINTLSGVSLPLFRLPEPQIPLDVNQAFRGAPEDIHQASRPLTPPRPPRSPPRDPVEIDLTEDSPEIAVTDRRESPAPMSPEFHLGNYHYRARWESPVGLHRSPTPVPAGSRWDDDDEVPNYDSPRGSCRTGDSDRLLEGSIVFSGMKRRHPGSLLSGSLENTPWEREWSDDSEDPDEPGPSSSRKRPRSFPRTNAYERVERRRDTESSETSENSNSSGEVAVLCEMKPKHLRTPELVTLAEDEDENAPNSQGNDAQVKVENTEKVKEESGHSTMMPQLDYRQPDFEEILRKRAQEAAKRMEEKEKGRRTRSLRSVVKVPSEDPMTSSKTDRRRKNPTPKKRDNERERRKATDYDRDGRKRKAAGRDREGHGSRRRSRDREDHHSTSSSSSSKRPDEERGQRKLTRWIRNETLLS